MKVNLRLPQAVAQPTTLSLHLPLAYMHLQMERTEAELHGGRKGKVRDAKGESRGSRRKPGRFYGRTRQPQKRTAKGPRPERADSREEREKSQERARVILTSRERPLGRSRKRRRRSPPGAPSHRIVALPSFQLGATVGVPHGHHGAPSVRNPRAHGGVNNGRS